MPRPGRAMKRRAASEDEDSGSEAGAPVAKKSKSGPTATSVLGTLQDDDGNAYWPVLHPALMTSCGSACL